jgi:hypothetical protein
MLSLNVFLGAKHGPGASGTVEVVPQGWHILELG